MKYEKDINDLTKVYKNAVKKLSSKSYHTKSFKADVQYNHMVNAMKKFKIHTGYLGPFETTTTNNICRTFDLITGGFGFSIPYHTVKRYEVVNCKKYLEDLGTGTYEQIDGLSEREVGEKQQLEKISKAGHRYAFRDAPAYKSNQEPLSNYKPLDPETVMILAKYMIGHINLSCQEAM